MDGGSNLDSVQLRDAKNRSDFNTKLKQYIDANDTKEWIVGGNWDHQNFTDKVLPHRRWLDDVSKNQYFALYRHDGHMILCNTKTLQLAGITRDTPNPPGGEIEHDSHGYPTGILKDGAMDLVLKHQAHPNDDLLKKYLDLAQNLALSNGVTAVHDMLFDADRIKFYEKAIQNDWLKTRVLTYAPALQWANIKSMLMDGIQQSPWFALAGLKIFSDGSLGSETALMLEAYENKENHCGLIHSDFEDETALKAIIEEADTLGLQMAVHAIGDGAVRMVLDLAKWLIFQNGKRDRRFRIEHAQHIHPVDQIRFKELDIVASVQPTHCVDDSLWIDGLLGERSSYAYPFHTLQKLDIPLIFGSDWPVAELNPNKTLHSAIHRNNWHMNEALDLKTSLKAHTQMASWAGFQEHRMGVIKPEANADLVITEPSFLDIQNKYKTKKDHIVAVMTDGNYQINKDIKD